MVSLELQTVFFRGLNHSPYKPLIAEIVSEQTGSYVEDTSNSTNLGLNLLISVKEGDRERAVKYNAIFQKRIPSQDSDWIYDNFVMFSIVTATAKFGLETQWISEVINLSFLKANPIDKSIRETLKNILAGNYNAKDDLHQVSMVYQYLSKDEHFQDGHINKVYNNLWHKEFPFFEDDFLNIVSLKAIQVAFEKKSLMSERDQFLLKEFVPTFKRQISLISTVIAWFIIIGLIIGIFFGLWKINQLELLFPATIRTVFWIIGLSGVGVLSLIGWKKKMVEMIDKSLRYFFRFGKD